MQRAALDPRRGSDRDTRISEGREPATEAPPGMIRTPAERFAWAPTGAIPKRRRCIASQWMVSGRTPTTVMNRQFRAFVKATDYVTFARTAKVLKGGSHRCAPNYCRRYHPA